MVDIFDLDEAVIDRYQAFPRSFTDTRSAELNARLDELCATRRFRPEPLVQLKSHYADGGSIQDFIDAGDLEPECVEVFRGVPNAGRERDETLKLRKHQQQAVGYALSNRSYAVTTDTDSGKSLCFFIPIIDAAIRARTGDPKRPPICVGTSATMANGGAAEQRNAAVARIAAKIFSTEIGGRRGRHGYASSRDRHAQERRTRIGRARGGGPGRPGGMSAMGARTPNWRTTTWLSGSRHGSACRVSIKSPSGRVRYRASRRPPHWPRIAGSQKKTVRLPSGTR